MTCPSTLGVDGFPGLGYLRVVADDLLYVKPTPAGKELVPDAAEEPPYPGAKPYLMLPPERWEPETLCQLIRATFAELPRAKPRRRKT